MGKSDVFGDSIGAVKYIAPKILGPAFGAAPPLYWTGKRYPSILHHPLGTTLTTTATRLYYGLTYIWEIRSFAGVATRNSGAGDNGDTYRVGLYTHTAASGPTSLVKDFGEVTLTAAAGERVLSSSFTPPYIGWYWFAFHANQAAAMYRSNPVGFEQSAAGYAPNWNASALMGQIIVPISISGNDFMLSVDTAYGAFASTAVAPTASQGEMPTVALVA